MSGAETEASSVLVNAEEPDSVQLRKLGDEHGEQGHRVDDEVDPVVLGVEAGEEVATEDRAEEKGASDIREKTETREERHAVRYSERGSLYSRIITEQNGNVSPDETRRGC